MLRALFFSLFVLSYPLAYANPAPWPVRYLSSFLATNRVLWAETQNLSGSAPLRNLADIFEHICQWSPSSIATRKLAKDLRRIARREDSALQDRALVFETVRDSVLAYLQELPRVDQDLVGSLAADYYKSSGLLLAELKKNLADEKSEFKKLTYVFSQLEQVYLERAND